MSDQPEPSPATPPKPSRQPALTISREYFSSILAFVIVGAFLLMVGFTLPVAFNGTDEALTRAKDLLTLVSPFAGMVIGYYFNKATSDARAENAEENAKVATETAQKAQIEREKAVEQAQKSEKEIKEMRTDLLEMWTAAEETVKQVPGDTGSPATRGLGTLSGEESSSVSAGNKTMWKLQEALKRAEKWK